MILRIYNNGSDEHVLDKDITQIGSDINITLKDDVDVLKPVIILSNTVPSFNYAYIPDFGRYYFVSPPIHSQQRNIYQFDVDPLMSWQHQIRGLNVIANRSSTRFNDYQMDNTIPFLQDSIVTCDVFPNGFQNTAFILAVNGG